MVRVLIAVLGLIWLGGSAVAASGHGYAYLTGVYWFDGQDYQMDVTCWNVPGNPEGGLVLEIKMRPGGSEAEAPTGWFGNVWDDAVWWATEDGEHMIPPGEWLSGFRLTTDYDPGDVSYSYTLRVNRGLGDGGEFPPEYIPEPWLAGPVALVALAPWRILRRRP